MRRSVAAHQASAKPEESDPVTEPAELEGELTEVANPYVSISGQQQKLEIQDELRRLHVLINELEGRRLASRAGIHRLIDELEARINFAFPNADLMGHHAEHLGVREDREFWKRLRMTTGMAAFWVSIVMLLVFAFTSRR